MIRIPGLQMAGSAGELSVVLAEWSRKRFEYVVSSEERL